MAKPPQANTDDPPRPTNGTPAETVAGAIPHDKMHTRKIRGESTSYTERTEIKGLIVRCGENFAARFVRIHIELKAIVSDKSKLKEDYSINTRLNG